MLFKNIYRIQHKDAFDMAFITNNDQYKNTITKLSSSLKQTVGDPSLEKYANLLDGVIPGQEILIKRMLFNIIESADYYKHINPNCFIIFNNIYFYT